MEMAQNYKQVQKVLLIILFANFGVAILKIVVGTLIRSSSMTADGFHSLSDGTSNIIALIGIHFAAKPADTGHPYGHHKMETLTGMAIGVLLLSVGIKVVVEAVGKFSHPVMPTITTFSLIALVITLGINIFVTTYERRVGEKLGSSVLISDATHTKSDIYITIGVLLTLLGVKFGLPPILDPIVSLVVAGFIFYAAWEVLKENGNVLLDASPIDTNQVRELILPLNGVRDVHKIRSRGTNQQAFLDMHVLVDPAMSIEAGHELEHRIEDTVRATFNPNTQVLVHIEPFQEGVDQTEKI